MMWALLEVANEHMEKLNVLIEKYENALVQIATESGDLSAAEVARDALGLCRLCCGPPDYEYCDDPFHVARSGRKAVVGNEREEDGNGQDG